MRVKLIRKKVHLNNSSSWKAERTHTSWKAGDVYQTELIATFTMSIRQQQKLKKELDSLNMIFAGGHQNLRYQLVSI